MYIIWRCTLALGSSAVRGSTGGTIWREDSSWTSADPMARMLMPKPLPNSPRNRPVVYGSGMPQLMPNAYGSRHGFVTCPNASKIGPVAAAGQVMPEDLAEVDGPDLEHRP